MPSAHNHHLMLVSGPPCSGKSTVAKPIVTEFRCTWLEIDCIGDPFSLIRDQELIHRRYASG